MYSLLLALALALALARVFQAITGRRRGVAPIIVKCKGYPTALPARIRVSIDRGE